MARRYDKGQIVGESDEPKTIHEWVQWTQQEIANCQRLREAASDIATRTYLSGREFALKDLLSALEKAPVPVMIEDFVTRDVATLQEEVDRLTATLDTIEKRCQEIVRCSRILGYDAPTGPALAHEVLALISVWEAH